MKKCFCKLNSKGFTLFELIVAIAVLGLILSVSVSQIGNYLETDMKKISSQLSSTVRYLYNKSVTEGVYLRLVIDVSENSYWVEATRDPVLVSKKEITSDKKKFKNEEDEEQVEKQEEAQNEEFKGEQTNIFQVPKLKINKPSFSQVESYLLKPTRLPDNIFFKDVSTEHSPVPTDSGQVSIYFFPNGYVEHAVINLKDEDDELNYSLETNPIIGTVKVENEYKMLEKE